MRISLFTVSGITFHTYGLLIGIGIMLAYLVIRRRIRNTEISNVTLDNLFLCVLLSGFLSAKLLYIMTDLSFLLSNPSKILDMSNGYVVYGGILGGLIGGYVYCRVQTLDFLTLLDLVMPSVVLAQAFGRIGCYLAGCCYGLDTSSVIGVTFPSNSLAPSGVSLLPIQLISSFCCFGLFCVLLVYNRYKRVNGQVGVMYFIIYSAGRFILEYFRGDLLRGSIGMFSTSQFISIFICLVGVISYINILKRSNRNG